MNFTKTIPTKPGAYWWRKDSNHKSMICYVFFTSHPFKGEQDETLHCKKLNNDHYESVRKMGGEWCGPLVEAEELKLAFCEGVLCNSHTVGAVADAWKNSRARRVAEGEEV